MEPQAPRKRRIGWTGVIGVVLSVGLLWWALRDVHWAEIRMHVANANWGWLAACVAAATLRFPIVTERWRYLLRLDGAVLPFVPLWHATAIGFMANNVVPARAGELARPLAAMSLTSVRFTTAAASVAIERVFDGITIILMLVLAAGAGGFVGSMTVMGVPLPRLVNGAAVVFAAALVVAFLAVWQQAFALRVTDRIARGILSERWAQRVTGLVGGLFEGLDVLRSPRRFGAVFLWSLVAWGLNGLSFLFCMYAFDIAAPWTAAFVVQSVIALSVALPQAPGFWGVFEAATRATFVAYAIDPNAAVSYAVTYHITTFIPITLLGIWSLGKARLTFSDLRGRRVDEPAPADA